ncbi:hypothetical protein ACXYUI_33155, partial [Klebsiella pneumoniae]
MSQKRSSPVTGTVIGEGKLQELALLTGGSGVVAGPAATPRLKKQVASSDHDEDGSVPADIGLAPLPED